MWYIDWCSCRGYLGCLQALCLLTIQGLSVDGHSFVIVMVDRSTMIGDAPEHLVMFEMRLAAESEIGMRSVTVQLASNEYEGKGGKPKYQTQRTCITEIIRTYIKAMFIECMCRC